MLQGGTLQEEAMLQSNTSAGIRTWVVPLYRLAGSPWRSSSWARAQPCPQSTGALQLWCTSTTPMLPQAPQSPFFWIRRIVRSSLPVTLHRVYSARRRNVTAMYVHMFARGGLLLDCGEGTYGQLRRRYGAAGADDIVSKLAAVWISHIHADHHAGLARHVCSQPRCRHMPGGLMRR